MGVRVSVVQMNSGGDLEVNLKATERLVRKGADDGAKLIVVPECFAELGTEQGKLAVAEPLPEGGPILERMARLAEDTQAELVLGGFWETGTQPDKVRNACVQVRADGSVGAVYRKIHLFDVDLADGTKLCESDTVEAGVEAVVADSVVGALGLSICYDLRFPELYRQLVVQGATTLVVPAAFTLHTGKDHWHALLRARAIENQAFVLAAAQTGRHSSTRVSYGNALICDPWGTVLAMCGEGEGVATATLDFDYLERVRSTLPSLKNRRLGLDAR